MSPYENLPPRSFWKSAVSNEHPLLVKDLYRARFPIQARDRIATAGSCFAQHIGVNLKARGFNVIDVEPPPRELDVEAARRFGYALYSARYGNIYTMRQLVQLAVEAFGEMRRDIVWERNGRYYDALRPSVEPEGLDSPEEVLLQREEHLAAVRRMFKQTSLFVFTFGLTEAWVGKNGIVYPTAPGTLAGEFDASRFEFHNFTYDEVLKDFMQFRRLMLKVNRRMRFLITVSPVPLTATATGHHVLAATTYSKSVLRAVAGELYSRFPDVDYFPSYELIATPFARGFFYENNLRAVSRAGVENVMRVFFEAHQPVRTMPEPAADASNDPVCEEELLDAFSR